MKSVITSLSDWICCWNLVNKYFIFLNEACLIRLPGACSYSEIHISNDVNLFGTLYMQVICDAAVGHYCGQFGFSHAQVMLPNCLT